MQVAYAVPDAERAALHWVQRGVGPFFLRRHIPVSDVRYRGRPSSFDHTSAYAQWGQLMVELVEDHGAGPSAVRDMYAVGESGLHHLAFFVDDLDAVTTDLESAGVEMAMTATARGGVRFHFADTRASLGHMIELYEPTDHLRSFYATVAAAAAGWDGREPVRAQ